MSRRVLPVVAAATVLGAALLLSVRPAAAQSVLGRVLDQDSGAPLQGVFLTLTDSLGHRATGTLSREDGTFVLRARHPGTYLLRLELIGYSAMAETVRVDADDADPRVFRMPTQAVELEGLVATSERGACTVRPSEGDALARLWDTARQGLRLAEWSAEAGWLRASGYTYQRVLQLTDSEVLTEQVRRRPSVEPAAFTAVDPVEARDRGFVVAEEDGSILYHGADAALLLSDEFLDTHCFTLRQRPDEGLTGLGFEPVPGRHVPEIQGVLWLDSETARLRHLEYRYTDHFSAIPLPPSRFGGRTEFRHLPDGSVGVQRWWIRMPRFLEAVTAARASRIRRCGTHACEDGSNLRRLTDLGLVVVEEGGTILSYQYHDGTRLPAAERAAIAGVVVDSTSGTPSRLADAEVFIAGTEERAVTDASGRFRFSDLDAGTYRLTFQHPRLAELGVRQPGAVVVEARRGEVASTRLALPSPATLALGRCGALEEGLPDASARVIHGYVLDGLTGAAIQGATVQAVVVAQGSGEAGLLEEATDATGAFLFCDAPAGDVSLTAHFLGKGSETQGVRTRPGVPAEASFTLILSAAGRVMGRVVRVEDREGVDGARVRVAGSDLEAVTGESGWFTLDSIPPGTVTLETTHVGYQPTTGHLSVRGGEIVEVELLVAEQVFDLEPIVVTARSSPLLRRRYLGGFHTRRERAVGGTFYWADDFAEMPNARPSDFLDRTHGVRLNRVGLGGFISSSRGFSACPMVLYLDGMRVSNAFYDQADPTALARIDEFRASDLAGIEVYPGPSTVPGEFMASGTECGVVAVWTRNRDRSDLRPDGLNVRP